MKKTAIALILILSACTHKSETSVTPQAAPFIAPTIPTWSLCDGPWEFFRYSPDPANCWCQELYTAAKPSDRTTYIKLGGDTLYNPAFPGGGQYYVCHVYASGDSMIRYSGSPSFGWSHFTFSLVK